MPIASDPAVAAQNAARRAQEKLTPEDINSDWLDDNIDFIGIDNYLPLSDWRDGSAHLDYDAANGPTDIHDMTYLTRNIQGGEDYDWYYASDADRTAQTRTPITDGLGKPWVWRAKDFWN